MAGEPPVGQVTIGKTFTGELSGGSVTTMLGVQTAGGAGYVAMERFTGSIAGRTGSVVFQHWGTDNGGAPVAEGHIVPGTGGGELAGLTGRLSYVHDETAARITLQVTFPAGGDDA